MYWKTKIARYNKFCLISGHLRPLLPRPVLGQVREEARQAKVLGAVRVRRHLQHPWHGEERDSAGAGGEDRGATAVRS